MSAFILFLFWKSKQINELRHSAKLNLLGPTLDSAVRQWTKVVSKAEIWTTTAQERTQTTTTAAYEKRVQRDDNVGTYLTYVEEGDQQIQFVRKPEMNDMFHLISC